MIARFSLVALLALLFAAPAAADPAADAANKAQWQTRYAELRADAAEASERFDELEKRFVRGRHRRTLRGNERAELAQELDLARKDRADATAALAAFPEEARRAGVPPGWLRDVE